MSLLSDEERARLQLAELSTSSPDISHPRAETVTNGDLDNSANLNKATLTGPVNGSSTNDKALPKNDSETTPFAFTNDSPQVGV